MSLAKILGFLATMLGGLFSGAKSVATAAESSGLASVTVLGQTVPLPALVNELNVLAAQDWKGMLAPADFTNLVGFLESQQFANDLVPIGDVLSLVGLVFPAAAVAASDIKAAALVLTLLHKFFAIVPLTSLASLGSLSNNAGETQAADITSSVGL